MAGQRGTRKVCGGPGDTCPQIGTDARIGGYVLPPRALVYNDESENYPQGAGAQMRTRDVGEELSKTYNQISVVWSPEQTRASDYLSRLAEGWSYLYLHAHGGERSDAFLINGKPDDADPAESGDIRNLDPKVAFYSLCVCVNARYTDEDYIAGWYVFVILRAFCDGLSQSRLSAPSI
jgi:hypothetical protein